MPDETDRYEQALQDIEAIARHWLWAEDGETGTGEAFTLIYAVHLVRSGHRPEIHDDERGRRTWERAQRRLNELLQLANQS